MAIISVSFLIFSTISVLGYFILPMKARAYWLLCASVFFYACFDLKYFCFLLFSVLSTYIAAILIRSRRIKARKTIVALTIVANIGVLFIVKFLNYSLSLLSLVLKVKYTPVSIIVPLGIAFYSMQAVSYLVDVYKEKIQPEKKFFKYTLYMTYFPIIMQGPISRYDQLAHQLYTPHTFSFERLKSGMLLAMYGFFKKMVIADRAAVLVNQVFGKYSEYEGLEIFIAMLFYTLQIYTDFSGCVDISRGISEIFGIELINNFKHPYFAVSIKDFWRRWHISLSSWFRDYIYIPLGGSRKGELRKFVNLFIVFLASGLWHGVGFHYVAWGLINAIFQTIGELTEKIKIKIYDKLNIDRNSFSFNFGRQFVTFLLVNFAWLFFRADGFIAACRMLGSAVSVFNPWILTNGKLFELGLDSKDWNVLIISVLILLVVSILQQRFSVREKLNKQNCLFRYIVYIIALLYIMIFGIYGPGYNVSQFIYMQF